MPSPSKYLPDYSRQLRGVVIHQANAITPTYPYGTYRKVVLDGQYEPHGGRWGHSTKAEKKHERKMRTAVALIRGMPLPMELRRGLN